MKQEFKSKSENEHIRAEEQQWAEIFAEGNAFASMLLLQVEKLCALAHEFEKLFKAGSVREGQVKSLAAGLAWRVDMALDMLPDAGEHFEAEALFRGLKAGIERLENNEKGLDALGQSVDKIHKSCHLLVDEIYGKIVG
ncbi:MAG: hypothetical protein JW744_04560 [Candidatus Diapherotrites archaeon]|uniref:Uncharacterized protein n=1 Tax=Candidatus Iainarchaeum sp. TaxID=3101447 RepID=A0A939C6Q9_9ARCH|nr:hypothetical protein [Candidatus Diapherotrites archaeon]